MGLNITQLTHVLDQLADGRNVCNDDQNKLKAVLTKIQSDEHFDDVFYFGKVDNSHVVYGLVNGTLEKKWYCAGDDFVFDDMDAEVPALEEAEAEDEEKVAERAVKVEAKLAFAATVRQIDDECNIVPKGSWRVKEAAYVPAKVSIDDVDHTNVSNWFHLRTPKNFAAQNTASRVDAQFQRSVLDACGDSSVWATRCNSAGNLVKQRHLAWPGAVATFDSSSGQHGFVYLGSGRKNKHLAFDLP